MTTPQVEVQIKYDALRVLINGVLHLHLSQRSKLLGVQAWKRPPEGRFIIEYTMIGGTIMCDYDEPEKWFAVLRELEKVLDQPAVTS